MARTSDDAQPKSGAISRRSLIATSAGVATTAAVTVVSPTAAVAMGFTQTPLVTVSPSTPIPAHPVVAYVHDAARGEITIVSGTGERTYRDVALVKRLLAAAKSQAGN